MLEKYVDERWPPAMVFRTSDDGSVTVCTVQGDLASGLSLEAADHLVTQYNRLQSLAVRLALAFDAADHDAFQAFWYGSELASGEPPAGVDDAKRAKAARHAALYGSDKADQRTRAMEALAACGIPVPEDFHRLDSDRVRRLLEIADAWGYRRPANANGSRGRYFHAMLQRRAQRQEG